MTRVLSIIALFFVFTLANGQSEIKTNKEGIKYIEIFKEHFEVSSSNRLILKSFTIQKASTYNSENQNFELTFNFPQQLDIKEFKLSIEDEKGQYYVEPKLKPSVGINNFIWESNFAKGKNIYLKHLLGVARGLNNKLKTVIFPLRISSKTDGSSVSNYQMVFISNRSVSLSYSIYDSNKKLIIGPIKREQASPNSNIKINLNVEKFTDEKYFFYVKYNFSNGTSNANSDVYEFYHTK